MRIFNSFRKKLLGQAKMKTYFSYAIGEIILVVVGIFIGLQVNRWSVNEIKHSKIDEYFEKISDEIAFQIKLIHHNTEYSREQIEKLKVCLEKIEKKKVDSIFKGNIKHLTYNQADAFFFPVIDEFLGQGYLSYVDNDSLRHQFQLLDYNRQHSEISDKNFRYFDTQILKPALVDKINYLKLEFLNENNKFFDLKKMTFENAHPVDYHQLISDLEIWNLIIYKIGLEKNRIVANKSLASTLEKINIQLKKELGNQ